MRSEQIEKAKHMTEKEKANHTDLQVLHSNAGWYVGTLYQEKDPVGNVIWTEPGSRDTDYFKSQDDAARYLRIMEQGFDLPVRKTPDEGNSISITILKGKKKDV